MKRPAASALLLALASLAARGAAQTATPAPRAVASPTLAPSALARPTPEQPPSLALPLPLPQPACSPPLTPAGAAPRPNIVLVLADDLDAAGYDTGGLNLVKTNVVNEGAWVPNFLLSQPLCCPSRSSILLGQYAHNHGVFGNKSRPEKPSMDGGYERFLALNLEMSTVATCLQSRGYRTGLFGKYLNRYPNGKAQTYIPPGWNKWFVDVAKIGADYPSFNYTANDNGTLRNFGRRDPATPNPAPNTSDYFTDQVRDRAVTFIDEALQSAQPFFLYLAPHAPHLPAVAPARHQGAFAALSVPRTPAFNEADVNDKPGFVRGLPDLRFDRNGNPTPSVIQELDADFRQRARSELAIGELVRDVVARLGSQRDNTYVFFVSDNGLHLGQHRLPPGKSTVYEEDIRVPMAVRGPGIARGSRVDDLVGNVDLAPTFIHIASGQPDDQPPPRLVGANGRPADGRSLLPLLHGRPVASRRQAYLIERFPDVVKVVTSEVTPEADGDDPVGAAFAELTIPAFVALRTPRYTFAQYQGQDPAKKREMYDLFSDPNQLCNLMRRETCSPQPPAPNPTLVNALVTRLNALKTCSGQTCTDLENQPLP